MSDLMNKLRKNTTIKDSDILEDSKFFTAKDLIPTTVPAVNIALSGQINGGFTPGLTIWAGPSKHFKTSFSLLMAKAYMDKYQDSVVLFYDSEFGTPQAYFNTFGIPFDRVVHTPIMDVEELKFDIMKQLTNIERSDHVMIIIDSIGNLASKKEVEDALNEKSVADMSRAKQLKSLFRMITPYLTLRDIPMAVINHTYKEIGLYPKDIVGGGTGSYYGSDNIWILGRQQDKDSEGIQGYHFVINVEKSRYVKEKSKIPISVSFEGGINRWSGLLDVALDGNYIVKPKNGWYARVNKETGEVLAPNMRASDIEDNGEFWKTMFKETDFAKYIKERYSIAHGAILGDENE